jgi:transposase
VRASGLHWLDGFVTIVANWREEISHYFLQRQRSGVVEGLNNKRTVRL